MNEYLFLDDMKHRHIKFARRYSGANITHLYRAHDAIQVLKKKKFAYIFLDHDLNGAYMEPSGPGTGFEVAQFLSKNTEYLPTEGIVLHSLNPKGRANMVRVLQNIYIDVLERPYIWEKGLL